MRELTVAAAAAESGWSPRMLRYLERQALVVPRRRDSGYRVYGLGDLNRLRGLRDLRGRFGVTLADIAFAARIKREPELRVAVDGWLASGDDRHSWIDW